MLVAITNDRDDTPIETKGSRVQTFAQDFREYNRWLPNSRRAICLLTLSADAQ
jgi:hypothetical protein